MMDKTKRELFDRTIIEWADSGIVNIALKLSEFHLSKSQDPYFNYLLGILYRDYLGDGIHASEQFQIAALSELTDKEVKAAAIENRCLLSSSYEEFFDWHEKLQTIDPNAADNMNVSLLQKQAESDITWGEDRRQYADKAFNDGQFGICASVLAIILDSKQVSRRDIADFIKNRIFALRELDKKLSKNLEYYQKADRTALRASLKEIENCIELDSSDSSLWNSKGLCETELSMFDEAITSFKKSLEIRDAIKPRISLSIAYSFNSDFTNATSELDSVKDKVEGNSENKLLKEALEILEVQQSLTKEQRLNQIYYTGVKFNKQWIELTNRGAKELGFSLDKFKSILSSRYDTSHELDKDKLYELLTSFTPWLLSYGWLIPEYKNHSAELILSTLGDIACENNTDIKSACAQWVLSIWLLNGHDKKECTKRWEYLKTILDNNTQRLTEIANNIVNDFDKVLDFDEEEYQKNLPNRIDSATPEEKEQFIAALNAQALQAKASGNIDKAMELWLKQEEICREIDNKFGLQQSLAYQAIIYKASKQFDEAIIALNEQINICDAINEEDHHLQALRNKALVLQDRDDLSEALRTLQKMEELCKQFNRDKELAQCLLDISITYLSMQDMDFGMKYLKDAEILSRRLDLKNQLALVLSNVATVLTNQNKLGEASLVLEEAYEISVKNNLSSRIHEIQNIQGHIEKLKYEQNYKQQMDKALYRRYKAPKENDDADMTVGCLFMLIIFFGILMFVISKFNNLQYMEEEGIKDTIIELVQQDFGTKKDRVLINGFIDEIDDNVVYCAISSDILYCNLPDKQVKIHAQDIQSVIYESVWYDLLFTKKDVAVKYNTSDNSQDTLVFQFMHNKDTGSMFVDQLQSFIQPILKTDTKPELENSNTTNPVDSKPSN